MRDLILGLLLLGRLGWWTRKETLRLLLEGMGWRRRDMMLVLIGASRAGVRVFSAAVSADHYLLYTRHFHQESSSGAVCL